MFTAGHKDGTYVANSIEFANGAVDDNWHHIEIDYLHDDSTLKFFADGTLEKTFTGVVERLSRTICLGINTGTIAKKFYGAMRDLQIYDGVALHSKNFTPN